MSAAPDSSGGWAVRADPTAVLARAIEHAIGTPKPLVPLVADPIAALRAMQTALAAAPPSPYRIVASHRVPFGRIFRQWDTLGRLQVWVNRGEIADMPRRTPAGASMVAPSGFGMPVVNV